MDPSNAKVVVLGGGTGTRTMLTALRGKVGQLTAVVNTTDSGGSSGDLRQTLRVLPPGDIRQCLEALCPDPELAAALSYRFDTGSLKGHPAGNVLLAAMQKVYGSLGKAVQKASEMFKAEGMVVPVTLDDVQLCLKRADGTVLYGEANVTQTQLDAHESVKCWLHPAAALNPAACDELLAADLIVIGPGNLYSSLIPTLLVRGMPETLNASRALKLFVCNLVQFPRHTEGFLVHHYLEQLERTVGPPAVDVVLYNTQQRSGEAFDGVPWVGQDADWLARSSYRAIGAPLVSAMVVAATASDPLERNRFRHDGKAVVDAITMLLNERQRPLW